MRTTYKIILFAATLSFAACSKKIPGATDNLAALNPSNEDVNAGTWKTVLLPRPDTFAVAAPLATNSNPYLADLNEIKGYQKNLTDDQMGQINYWGAGGVLRWNEIMRDLVAKYNLPPVQNANGTYPIPSSTNPFAYPLFPFSNPPYAARAYAYVAAAQYDALVACWYYKTQYNWPRPYAVDSTIRALVPKTTLPSYPSEEAVLAGATAEMMQLLFPDEIANIQQKLQDQELATIMSGAAARSDIVAGEQLGRQIADVFIARGRADNAGKAVGTPTEWDSLSLQPQISGQSPWVSLEVPARPPMLPLFGNVKPFLFSAAEVVALRPPPPPNTESDSMKAQTEEIYNFVKNPSASQIALVQFWADGAGTYTPAGHWNAIAASDFIQQGYSEVRWARNMALLNMTLMDAAITCWSAKYYYFNPRPSQMDPRIKTLTGIPNFPAYISGHSTFSGAASTILGYLIPARANAYQSMAQQASLSRVMGGIHFRNDCSIGLTVGEEVAQFAVQRAETDGAN